MLTQAAAQIGPGDFIDLEHLPPTLVPGGSAAAPTPTESRSGALPPDARAPTAAPPDEATLRALLTEHRGNVALVARCVGLHRELLYRALRKYGLDPADFRA